MTIAQTLIDRSRLPEGADLGALAVFCGLTIAPAEAPGVALAGTEIRLDVTAKGAERQRLLAEGIARWALRSCFVDEHDIAVHCVSRQLRVARRRRRVVQEARS